MDPEAPTEDALESLSLGHKAEIGRIESALFGGPAAPVEVGGFAIVRTIGRGAFGTVYEARDPELGRGVAIKVLAADDQASQAKLVREAKLMATVSHPNIAAVYQVGTFELAGESKVYVVMELVDGATLRRHLDDARQPEVEVVDLLVQAGRGLAAAHGAGVIHRDFKPDNVLVGADGRVRVVDFGLAATSVDAEAPPEIDVDPTSPTTATRGLIGTPAYMAPEVFAGGVADESSDQFSFCVTLFEALHGRRPFSGRTWVELATNVTEGRLVEAPQRVSTRVRRVLARGLSAKPSDRYASMDELLGELAVRRWMTRWHVLGAASVATAAGVAVGASMGEGAAEPGHTCAVVVDSLDAALDEQRRAAVKASFVAAAPGYGADAWQRTETRLMAYAERWREAAVASCERDTESEQARTLRSLEVRCLERARDRMTGLLDVFAEPTSAVVDRAVRSAQALPSPDKCLDSARLMALAPRDPTQRVEAARIRGVLATLATEHVAGRFDAARSQLDELAADATTLGFAPTIAEVLAAQAQFDLQAGNYADARSAARTAFDSAVAGGDHQTATLAATSLAQAGLVDPQQTADSLDWVETGRKLAQQVDDAERLLARLAVVEASLLIYSRNAERAGPAVSAAVTTLRELDPNHPNLPSLLGNWGTWLLQLGRPAEAIEKYEEALAAVEAGYGPNHPDAGQWLLGLGSAAMTVGRRDDSEAYLQRALQVYEGSVGVSHPNAVSARMYLGVLEHQRADYVASIGHFETALSLADAMTPAQPGLAAEICIRLADTLSVAGFHERAATIVERAATGYAEVYPVGDPRHASVYAAQMVVAERAGRPHDALTAADKGLAVTNEGDPMTVNLLHESGRILVELGRLEDAKARLERAAEMLRDGIEDPWRRALVDFELARVWWPSDPDKSRTLARAALDGHPTDTNDASRQRIEDWIAEH